MYKPKANHLTYLLPLILLPVAANPVRAEIEPAATNQETAIASFDQWLNGAVETRENNHDAKAIVSDQTLPVLPQVVTSQAHDCNKSLSSLPANATTCNHSQPELKQVPRTLKEAGFSNQPIRATNSISQTVTPETATPANTPTPSVRVSPRIGGSFTTGPGVGYESSFGAVEGFVPLSQKPGKDLAFLQGRAIMSTEDARLGGNVVLGYRSYSRQDNRIWGGYVSYDIRDTGKSNFNQVGLGLESLGDSLDFRANGYIPVGDTRNQVAASSSISNSFTPQVPNFQGNFLAIGSFNQVTQLNRRFEAAMSGFDAEAGVKLARLGETGAIRGYAGLYYYGGPGTDGIVGVRGRLEARPSDNFQLGLSLQRDDKFGTNLVFSIATNFPGTRPRGARREDDVVARLGEGVSRQENIVVDRQTESSLNSTSSVIFALNPATNQPYLFQHVNLGLAGGNGTFENPFGIVQNALNATRSDGNDIVYVQPGSNPGIPAFTIPNNVQVLSTGPNQVIPTVQLGNVQLPLSGARVLPRILPSGSNVPGVTMGSSTTLSGFAINDATDVGIGNEGSAGAGSNPISNVTIRDNRIANSGTEGIRLKNVTGVINLLNNTIRNSGVVSGGDGILIANSNGEAEIAITSNNRITENARAGISLLLENTAQATGTISSNNISGNGLQGILLGLIGDANNRAQFNNLTISENAIAGNGTAVTPGSDGSGIFLNLNGNANANNLKIAGNQIFSNNGAGIAINLRDNAQSAMTISENTISSNFGSSANVAAGLGIVASTFDNSTFRLLIDSNQINNNEGSGIFLQANGSSSIFSTVSNNILTNNQTNPVAGSGFGATGNFVAQSNANTTVCLNLANNTSLNPNPDGADFNLMIGNNTPAQFIYSATGNTPDTLNFFFFSALPLSPALDTLFTTPLGNCTVP